jgi:hypothetical protein
VCDALGDEGLARGAESEEEITRALAALTKKIEPQFAELERRVISSLAADRERLVRIEEAAGTIPAEARAYVEARVGEATSELRDWFETKIVEMAERLRSTAGRLPPVKSTWAEGDVIYAGQLLSYGGSLWQAKVDTGLKPGDPRAWILIARAGRDARNGQDARSMSFKGPHSASRTYNAMDLVMLDKQAWLCVRDDAKGVPGVDDCWVLLGARGPRGERGKIGPMGPQGKTGERGEQIHHWEIDSPSYCAFGVLTDGSILPPLTLRELFAQFQRETSE